jgi:hypothetical protein
LLELRYVPARVKDLDAAVRDQPGELGCARNRDQRILLRPLDVCTIDHEAPLRGDEPMPSSVSIPSPAHTPDELHAIIQDAINRADLDAFLDAHDDDATVVVPPAGRPVEVGGRTHDLGANRCSC